MTFKRFIPYFTLLLVVLISTFVVWSPFIFKSQSWFGLPIKGASMLEIYKQFDGPLYIIPAKTGYNVEEIRQLNRDSVLPQNPFYYAAHLPLYPIFIKLFSFIFGYLKSMVIVNIVCTILLAWMFYFVLKRLQVTRYPLLLSSIFLFLPRFLVVRTVGAPESLFMLCIVASLYFFEKEKYIFAGFLGALATLTKTPGVLLFGAYGLVFLERYLKTKKINVAGGWIVLIPLGFLAVCLLYSVRMGDFFAYFHSGDNIHLVFPFSVFNFQKTWIGTAWLEDVLFYFFLYGLTVFQLKGSKHRSLFYFSLVFWVATLFVQHRDISRYSLALWPMAAVAFEHFFTSKKFLIVFAIMLLGIYMYAWNFLTYNVMPINEWLPFL